MSDLRRWPDEGATAEERSLLVASRKECPDPLVRERVLQALAAASSVRAPEATDGRSAAVGSTAKIVSLAVLALGLASGAAVWRSMRHPVGAPPPVDVAAVPASARVEATLPNAALVPVPSSDEPAPAAPPSSSSGPRTAGAPKAPGRPPRAVASEPSLAQEVAALERAQKLVATDPGQAIALLDRYRVRFPAGKLWDEETVLRVEALLAAGKRDEALALASSFVHTHPENPYARRAQDMVRDERK